MLVDRDQAVGAGHQRIAEHFEHLDAGARRAARWLGHHQLARLGPAQVGHGRGTAHPLVHRGEPGLAGPVELDHAVGDMQQPIAGTRDDAPAEVTSSGVDAERDHCNQP